MGSIVAISHRSFTIGLNERYQTIARCPLCHWHRKGEKPSASAGNNRTITSLGAGLRPGL